MAADTNKGGRTDPPTQLMSKCIGQGPRQKTGTKMQKGSLLTVTIKNDYYAEYCREDSRQRNRETTTKAKVERHRANPRQKRGRHSYKPSIEKKVSSFRARGRGKKRNERVEAIEFSKKKKAEKGTSRHKVAVTRERSNFQPLRHIFG